MKRKMSLPNYLAKIKSAGIYRFVWDKSQMPPQQAETLRLVVGYSEKGPFNTPVYVDNETDFIKIYGNISKKLEKRGVFFHRNALQALKGGPILVLNLKKFAYETVSGQECDNVVYAAGNPVSSTLTVTQGRTRIENVYNTARFWSLDPDGLHDKVLTNAQKASTDRYYVITAADSKETSCTLVLRSFAPKGYDVTIKSWYANAGTEMPEYFEGYEDMLVSDFFVEAYVFRGKFDAAIASTEELKRYFTVDGANVALKPTIEDAFGNTIDTLDTLAADANSGFIQKYQGVTLPYFKDLNGAYLSLDLIFNGDNDVHKMLMKFDDTMLDNGDITVMDVATRGWDKVASISDFGVRLGTQVVHDGEILIETVEIANSTLDYPDTEAFTGVSIVASGPDHLDGRKCYALTAKSAVASVKIGDSQVDTAADGTIAYVACDAISDDSVVTIVLEGASAGTYTLLAPSKMEFAYTDNSVKSAHDAVFVKYSVPASLREITSDGKLKIKSLGYAGLGFSEGDRFLMTTAAASGSKVATLASVETTDDAVILGFANTNASVVLNGDYLIKCNHTLGDTIGTMLFNNCYFEGYTMSPSMIKPASSKQGDKLDWQNKILSVLKEPGLFEALTNNTDVEYRLLVDTFESYVDTELKSTLSYLVRKKDNALGILNFPAVSTFVNCEYTSFTDSEGFKMKYVVDGGNKRKPIGRLFTLPLDTNGASWVAFYTPAMITDGTVKTAVPSAALVSNLFMEKYNTGHAYDVVAGPNRGRIIETGLVGPDYNYSRSDLDLLEPFGVNCLVFVPRRGTLINSNQTAKQTPKSALSSVNVRELVIYLQDEIAYILQSYQWELNTQPLRDTVKAKADVLLENVKNNGGVYDYKNQCDDKNNTDEVIDNEMFVIGTSIEPARGAGKMVEELTIYRKGGMSSSAI